MPDFLPRRGSELLSWSNNFDQKINASPQSFGLTSQQATQYSQLHAAFADAYQAANQPGTRTSVTIAGNKQAMADLKGFARVLSGIVRTWPGIGDDQLLSLGLRPRRRPPRRLERPSDAPSLRLDHPIGRTLIARLRDASSPASAAMPRDVSGATILWCVGDQPAASMNQWRHIGQFSRTFAKLEFPATLPPGTKLWLTASWFNSQGNGPWASPVYTHIGFGVGTGSKAA